MDPSTAPAACPVRSMPDVAEDSVAAHPAVLARVGMSDIELCLRRADPHGEGTMALPGRADIAVSLDDPQVRGIHMSRLYLAVQEALDRGRVSWPLLARAVAACRHSHRGFVRRAFLTVRTEWMIRRPSLVSGLSGWRSYPLELSVSVGEHDDPHTITRELAVTVTYSSACPCSTALSGQLAGDRLIEDFEGHESVPLDRVRQWLTAGGATTGIPHSQRSLGVVRLRLAPDDDLLASGSDEAQGRDVAADAFEQDLVTLIADVENVLTTPVQAAVKRADEQEFARLNGAQPMFCEDAARRMRVVAEAATGVADYRIEARHLESLHPHDAVAVAVRGVPGGFTS